MEQPPDYAPRHRRTYAPLLSARLLGNVPRWFGHMDSLTATVRAFEGGLKDGQQMTLGANRIQHGGEFLELQYLRGFSIGTEDWKRQNPAPFELYQHLMRDEHDGAGTSRLVEHIQSVLAAARNPPFPSLRNIFPRAWSAPAYLPLPTPRAPRPPLHVTTNANLALVGDTILIPQLPLPEGMDCSTVSSFWGAQFEELLLLNGFGCWITPEATLLARISSARTAAAVRAALPRIFAGERTPDVVEPRSNAANLFGSVFVKGSPEQIETLVRGRFLVTPSICLISLPNHRRDSDFVATFESEHYPRHQGETVIRNVARAFSGSADAIEVCVNAGLLPEMIFTIVTVEYVLSRGRHLWNIILPFPRRPGLKIDDWRRVCDNLEPDDGDGGKMKRVFLLCKVCGCWKHDADVCPTRAYDEWTGAIAEM